MKKTILILSLLAFTIGLSAQFVSKAWLSDLQNGRYRNPVLYADYPDPDVCRVGDVYYMVSSSFGQEPGLPVLQSRDLVNWQYVNHGLRKLPSRSHYAATTPTIRYHDGVFYIYYSVLNQGVFMIKTRNIYAGWDAPVPVMPDAGISSPCPIWKNGTTYLLYGYDGKTTGLENVFLLATLNNEGTQVVDKGTVLYDGHEKHARIGNAKIVQKDDYYYIFAAAKNAKGQSSVVALHSKNLFGSYDDATALFQDDTNFKGAYIGSYVETRGGEGWYLCSYNIDNFGNTLMLNPVRWTDYCFPIIGDDSKIKKTQTSKPYLNYTKPDIAGSYAETPFDTDLFRNDHLGLQWQWKTTSQPSWYFLDKKNQLLRLYSYQVDTEEDNNLRNVPNLLLQKLPSESFTLNTKIKFTPNDQNRTERAGIIVFGTDYAVLSMEKTDKGFLLSQNECPDAKANHSETANQTELLQQSEIYIRIRVRHEEKQDLKATFSYSLNGSVFYTIGREFAIKKGEDYGARIGIFCTKTEQTDDSGWIDVKSFVFDK